MSGVLEFEGFRALKAQAKDYLRGLTREVKQHVTNEVERVMSEIQDLRGAVDQELADDAAQNELIAQLKAQLEEAQSQVAAAVAGEAEAEAKLNEALSAAVEVTEKLKSNDPPREEPAPPEEPPGGFEPEPNA